MGNDILPYNVVLRIDYYMIDHDYTTFNFKWDLKSLIINTWSFICQYMN
jgi:hypothetical protein